MIETYWNEVFGQFKQDSGKFNIPGLPEPLMSAHFGVQNIIAEPTSQGSFTLCQFGPATHPHEPSVKCESLSLALDNSLFWEFQERLNPGALEFIKRLLPFLVTLKTPHYHFFIESEGRICATVIVGESDCGCFLFNLVVDEKMRGAGLGRSMFKAIQTEFSTKSTFYWTRHPWFTLGAKTFDLKLVLEAGHEK